MVRKAAHYTEFSALGFLTNWAMLFSLGKRNMPLGIVTGSAYAATDEIHQIFVDGRSCQFTDWALDTAGIITGTLIFLIIYSVINGIIKHKNHTKGDI